VDHEEAGVRVRRSQAVAAAVILVLAVGGAAYADRELEPEPLGTTVATSAASGAWYCPHGGGPEGWEAFLQVANPGERTATIRMRTLGRARPSATETITVEPGTFVRVPVPADGRERASMVEWFDQWVAVGWIARAGGEEGGVAAEPCAPTAGDRWLLPDGTSETERNDDVVVVMNPFSRDAVVSVVLLSERREPVVSGELTDIVLRPYRSRAIRLNDVVRGERTVSAIVDATVGRVVAGTLGLTVGGGGIRSALGYLGAPPEQITLPGGEDSGRTDLPVMNAGGERVPVEAVLLGTETEQVFAGLAESAPPPGSGRTFPATTDGPTSIVFAASGSEVAATRRTFGVSSDQGSTNGAAPSAAWLVVPAAFGAPSHPGIALANPGAEPAEVTLTALGPSAPSPVTVSVPPRSTVLAPQDFAEGAAELAVVAVAGSGTFVPASVSSSLGREGFATYAAALGIPVPDAWIPG
jgi:hypothetical protein